MNSNYKLQEVQDVDVVGQYQTGTSGQTHLLNSKISVSTASGKVCARTHAHTHTHTHTKTHTSMDAYIQYMHPYLCTECATMIQLQFAAHNEPNLISPHIPSAL